MYMNAKYDGIVEGIQLRARELERRAHRLEERADDLERRVALLEAQVQDLGVGVTTTQLNAVKNDLIHIRWRGNTGLSDIH